MQKIKEWYNGYRFEENAKTVYNPVSLAHFFKSGGKFNNYWFSTGTPTFLLDLILKSKFDLSLSLDKPVSKSFFDAFEVTDTVSVGICETINIDLIGNAGCLRRISKILTVGAQIGFRDGNGRHCEDISAPHGVIPGGNLFKIDDAITVHADTETICSGWNREINIQFIGSLAFFQLEFYKIIGTGTLQCPSANLRKGYRVAAAQFLSVFGPQLKIFCLGRNIPEGKLDGTAYVLEFETRFGSLRIHVKDRHHRHPHHIQIIQIPIIRGQIERKRPLGVVIGIRVTGTFRIRVDGYVSVALAQVIVQLACKNARGRTGTALQIERRDPRTILAFHIVGTRDILQSS